MQTTQLLDKEVDKCKKEFFISLEKAFPNLHSVLMKNAKQLHMKYYRIEESPAHLVIISGNHDTILIKLAKDCQFPRGFPVIFYRDSGVVEPYGFYPKFSNDSRQMATVATDFDGAIAARITYKWSGHLGVVVAVNIEGKRDFLVTTKNGRDPRFTVRMREMVETFMTPQLLDHMFEKKHSLCFESMTFADQTHGAAVLNEQMVCTAVSFQDTTETACGVNWLPHNEMLDFCKNFAVPVSDVYHAKAKIPELMTEVSKIRDNATLDNIEDILKQFCEHQYGNVHHRDVLGNCLEGLVMWLETPKGTVTIKYKFPNYTIRTMLIRSFLNKDYDAKMVTDEFLQMTNTYVRRWCVDDHERWIRFAKTCAVLHDKNALSKVDEPNKPAYHIRLCDHALTVPDMSSEFKPLQAENVVVVVVGPIGAGKTTVGDLLAEHIGGVHIDGDQLGMTQTEVMSLGSERNDFTVWKVIEASMQGKIPVISTGGGALFSQGRDQSFVLPSRLQTALGVAFSVVAVVMDGSVAVPTRQYPDTSSYDTHDVGPVIRRRLASGEWSLPRDTKEAQFVRKIQNLSTSNRKFAEQIANVAKAAYSWPFITSANFKDGKLSLPYALDSVNRADFPPSTSSKLMRAMQRRFLVGYTLAGAPKETLHHITLGFDQNRKIVAPVKEDSQVTVDPEGTLVTAYSGKASIRLILTTGKLLGDWAHITVDPADHPPAKMREVALAVRQGTKSITLETKARKRVTYDLSAAVQEPIALVPRTIFYI